MRSGDETTLASTTSAGDETTLASTSAILGSKQVVVDL